MVYHHTPPPFPTMYLSLYSFPTALIIHTTSPTKVASYTTSETEEAYSCILHIAIPLATILYT